jgi:hypothetical protein
MASTCNFLEEVKGSLAGLAMKPIALNPSLAHVEVEGGRSRLEVFQSEKISKAVFSAIEIDSLSVCEQSVIIWPQDNYDLPIFWCNLTQMPGVSFHIFDLIPVMDIVLWPQYGQRYLMILLELREKAEELLGAEVVEKNFALTSLVSWALSPYRIQLKITEEGIARLAFILKEYGATYQNFYRTASPVPDNTERTLAMRRRDAVRRLMKENDPGYPLMVNLFGEERTTEVFEIIF